MQEAKLVTDAVVKGVETGVKVVQEAWNLMDAATEKRPPSEVMSQAAVQRMQGKSQGG
jgi:hypothetical protein